MTYDTQPLDLYDLSREALGELLASWGAPRTLTLELWHALYRQGATSFETLPLPEALRARFAAETRWHIPQVVDRLEAPDGATRKDLLELADGQRIEVVLLRYRQRRSACISTQVGCACGCVFCATGGMGFVRQLTPGEIVAQVLHFQRELAAQSESLSNLVLMGMGEPFLNYENTVAALRQLLDPQGLGFPPRRITVSTAGIAPGIKRFAEEGLGVNLAISLHAATDALREQLMPINRRYPLAMLFEATRAYTAKTGRRVMFEWALIAGVNDSPAQAEALVAQVAGLPAHINLILLNPTPTYPGRPATPEAVAAFTTVLDAAGIPHTMRQRRGSAIAAGCGQLRARERAFGLLRPL
ncbi:MAG: 23S rRNA (adenine(2503)-C(2))-methyltransferase RlmN [Anaerolineae bacterium]|nr:23S rRNA (adenine(2503)-C(2))-methyltransferase RlmN [Anaerolineae bacterium]